tara:strand:- start:46 stop:270 length:225 start_codon:yes stop_codon:yes gene_type:complete
MKIFLKALGLTLLIFIGLIFGIIGVFATAMVYKHIGAWLYLIWFAGIIFCMSLAHFIDVEKDKERLKKDKTWAD